MTKAHLAGLILWRGGVVLIAGYLAYHALRVILTITDAQLELAIATLLVGVLFVFASVLGERIEDARSERSQRE